MTVRWRLLKQCETFFTRQNEAGLLYFDYSIVTLVTTSLALLFALVYAKEFWEVLKKRRQKKRLKEFDDLISGKKQDPDRLAGFLSGQTSMPGDFSIFFPKPSAEGLNVDEFAKSIAAVLAEKSLGHIDRVLEYGDQQICIDITVHEFVEGLDAVRKIIHQHPLPRETTLEYSGGDLPLFD